MRIAIMQPYFLPYAGYFRLFTTTDLFVVYDCVQFIRRGWIHRNRLHNHLNQLEWLTLPLKKAAQDIKIHSLGFAENSQQEWQNRLRPFPRLHSPHCHDVSTMVTNLTGTPLEFIIGTIQKICDVLKLPTRLVFSSTLNLPETIRGENRIIEIAKHFGAKEYINPPGGRGLYESKNFQRHDLKLSFLSDYIGPFVSIMERIVTENVSDLRTDILNQSTLSH